MATPSKLSKDQSSKLAGPIQGFEVIRHTGREICHQTTRPDSAKYLIPKLKYKNPSKPGSCLDLSGWEPIEFKKLRKMLLKMAAKDPGTFVWDEVDSLEFPKTTPEQVEFFVAAGFVKRDAERLAYGDAGAQSQPA